MLRFTIDKERDPDRSKLRGILEAQFAYERMSAARSLFAHLLAIVGMVIWLDAIWPDWLPPEVRQFSLVLWGSILVLLIWAAIEEYVSRRRLKRYLAAQKGVALDKSDELV
jgi:hypothetical protein